MQDDSALSEERGRNRLTTDHLAKIHELLLDLVSRYRNAQFQSAVDGGSSREKWHGLELLEEQYIHQQPPLLKATFYMDDDLCLALRVPKRSKCFVVEYEPDLQYRGFSSDGTRTVSIVHIGAMRRQKNFEEILTNLEAICLLRFKIG